MNALGCGGAAHFNRRTLLKAAGLGGAAWLTPVAEMLARANEQEPKGTGARSIIVLWLQGAPSQLETFDPHPGSKIAHSETKGIETSAPGVKLADGMQQTADLLDSVALVRSVTSKEGDHERATYNAKTGFRPDPTLVHPAIGAVLCHQLTDTKVEIPRHISIMPSQFPARGGYLGDQYDAYKISDPRGSIPDVTARVPEERFQQRLDDLEKVVESEFSRGRLRGVERKTLHLTQIEAARRMMTSEQLTAFDVSQEPQSIRDEYGDTPFGRGCLAAARLVGVGVRCVEVTLNGWDSHVNNLETQRARVNTLDPALAALIRDLKRRELFDKTIVLCGGEFGRTPIINPAGGRDHWPHGFSVLLAGGGIRGGAVYGETTHEPPDSERRRRPPDDAPPEGVKNPRNIADIHATVLEALGVNFRQELQTPIGRPMAICKGEPIRELLPNT
ncbi:MAG: DUF1501 domain-containing protein [Pirellulaceae bacterium]